MKLRVLTVAFPFAPVSRDASGGGGLSRVDAPRRQAGMDDQAGGMLVVANRD